jgi:hypothetical protein
MKPYRRSALTPAFGCVALTARNNRCSRRYYTEYTITFTWDPIAGKGIGAPSAPFCRMHGYLWELPPEDRIAIVGGWIGRAWNPYDQCYTVLTTVYQEQTGFRASEHWWALRRDVFFGDCTRITYDEAMAQKAR